MVSQRASRRRRSSHAIFTPAKPGVYGKQHDQQQQQQRPVTFAPNVTPVTFTDTSDDLLLPQSNPSASSPTATLFPPSETPAPAPTRKRCPPGKRRSQGYIPRPPNAFMLFRADFVRQKHVPGSIETNHGSLSKIIGTCWRQLPFEEKRFWEVKAKVEKAKHKALYPTYRFRPVHKKNKGSALDPSIPSFDDPAVSKRKEKQPTTAEDERRCDAVAQLLLEGKKGEELAQAVRHLDRERELHREMEMGYLGGYDNDGNSRRNSYDLELGYDSRGPSPMLSAVSSSSTAPSHLHMPLPMYVPPSYYGMNFPRRPSSVPLPLPDFFGSYNAPGIAIPSLPSLSLSRPVSPVGSIARHTHQHHHSANFLNPFQNPFEDSSSSSNHDFQFAPLAPSPQYAQQAFAPFVQPSSSSSSAFAFGGMYPTPNSQRSSLGLGHRRASSAQAMLMRSWTMPMASSSAQQQQQVERDHSPLPDVEAGLFDDFSFGRSAASSSSSSGSTPSGGATVEGGGGGGEVNMTMNAEGVDPMVPVLNGIDTSVDPVTSTSSNTPHSTHAASPMYGGDSPPLGSVEDVLPDFVEHHMHQQQQHQHHHLQSHLAAQQQQQQQHQHMGMEDILDMSAYGMYPDLDLDVDPIERSIGVVERVGGIGMGMEEGGMMMKHQEGYFEGVGGGGVYEV
ncbi:hypothetical protein M413DRAFT_448734 [Hebeloma cylindrosporum]|uniref:HMG box domain-containing protein n=1 Tax=Hebeloma cylindrosporum TaxID=76867 RepID=A0A0C2Y7J4_HEBCY|nr:hypothetical protein M413DRAFT_448734 [Hebeloma cylindrosporum h7]